MTVSEARDLMEEWTESSALRVHMEAVAACMERYAKDLPPEERDRWTVAGLLHDFDYEKHPTPEEHPFVGVRHLRERGVDEEILEAILGHADYAGVPRASSLAKTLYAVDELAGFLVACVKVRPEGIRGLTAKSVRKKLKAKAFAAAVSREDITRGAEDLGVDLDEHITTCIEALAARAETLGLAPSSDPSGPR